MARESCSGPRTADRSIIVSVMLAASLFALCGSGMAQKSGAKRDPNSVSVVEAEKRIHAHMSRIEERREAMTNTYYYFAGAATLRQAFLDAGIEAVDHADPWGKNGLGLTWSQAAKEFYTAHTAVLEASLQVIRTQGYAKKSDMAYLDEGMRRWVDYERRFPDLFRDLVRRYVEDARVIDQRNAYLRDYQAKLDRLSPMRPYPGGQINALNAEMYARTKEFDARTKASEDEEGRVQQMIKDHASTRLFTTIKEGTVTSTIE